MQPQQRVDPLRADLSGPELFANVAVPESTADRRICIPSVGGYSAAPLPTLTKLALARDERRVTSLRRSYCYRRGRSARSRGDNELWPATTAHILMRHAEKLLTQHWC
jgi:hypothetical protein